MSTSAIKLMFISFMGRFSRVLQPEWAWAAAHKPRFNLLTLHGCGRNWPFRGNSSQSTWVDAELHVDAFTPILTWLILGYLTRLVVDALPQGCPPINSSTAPSSLKSGAHLSVWPRPMGLPCLCHPQASAVPAPGAGHPPPPLLLVRFGAFSSTSPASAEPVRARVCVCVRACMSVCTQEDARVRFAILPPTE